MPGSQAAYEWNLSDGLLYINRDEPFLQSIKDDDEKFWQYLLKIAKWAICILHANMDDDAVHQAVTMVEKQQISFIRTEVAGLGKKK